MKRILFLACIADRSLQADQRYRSADLTGGHDSTSTAYWVVPVDGRSPRRIDLGDVEPTWSFWIDASIARNGSIAFTGATPMHRRELYMLDQ